METGPRARTVAAMKILVAGGGVAAIETVLALQALAGERVEIELLAPGGDFIERAPSVLAPFDGADTPRVALAELGVTRHRGALAAVEGNVAVTTDGAHHRFDRLVVAVGARPVEAVPGATLFRGPVSAGAVEAALRRDRVVLTAPDDAWTLPLYELALLSGRPDLTIVTPEARPLDVFGQVASEALERRIGAFRGDTVPDRVIDGALVTRDGAAIPADAVIALPRLQGPHIAGLPSAGGFIPVDAHARVNAIVFAAGDATSGHIKQGGLAAQQADAAAEAIAAEAGAPVTPRPFTRILRARLLTRDGPLELCRDLDAPAHKLAGRHLSRFLATKERV
jgi:sulfide:quinone oxidoreductase